jgi:acyl carrier protein
MPDIEAIILKAMADTNKVRDAEHQVEVSPTAAIFGPGSPLESLGLVAFLMDVEDALADAGHPITLSDARAMSQARSPFRDVPALTTYINTLVAEAT